MLIEIWERLRGYDKWIQTEATIKSSDLEEVEVGGANSRYYIDQPIDEWGSFCEIVWTDASGKLHTAEYEVSENSPLFQLYDGQTIIIRYNPTYPDLYYIRGVLRSKIISAFKYRVVPAIFIVLIVLVLFLRIVVCTDWFIPSEN